MSDSNSNEVSRRAFVGGAGLLAGGVFVRAGRAPAADDTRDARGSAGEIPRRVLGKTNVSTAVLSLGTGTVGLSPAVSSRQIADMVNVALDSGINFIDTARAYNNAEEGIGIGLRHRRLPGTLSAEGSFLAAATGRLRLPNHRGERSQC